MAKSLVNQQFEVNRERQGLTGGQSDDKSRKGSVDCRIVPLVHSINSTDSYFTTSSCSGRAILFTKENDVSSDSISKPEDEILDDDSNAEKIRKKGCKWLFVTHDEINNEEFMKVLANIRPETSITFKVEPTIFHVQCKDLEYAKKLIHSATEAGFRNSGMVVGKLNKVTVAIRSTLLIEIPLKLQLLKSNDLINFWIEEANEKLKENWKRTQKLHDEFLKHCNK